MFPEKMLPKTGLFINPAEPSMSYEDAATTSKEGFIQKLTGNTDAEELVSLDHLQWALESDVAPIDIMRRVRETYRDVYPPAELMTLANDIGRRLYDLQDRAEQLEKVEREVEGLI